MNAKQFYNYLWKIGAILFFIFFALLVVGIVIWSTPLGAEIYSIASIGVIISVCPILLGAYCEGYINYLEVLGDPK